MSHQALQVFARAPETGKAKTRLIPALGPEGAAILHAGLVERTLQTACGQGRDVQLWCHPNPDQPFFSHCADRFAVTLHPQTGDDLGQRMAHALTAALKDHEHAVLIGTDCPGLTTKDLDRAFAALEEGADAVFGPASDGGYYLVGLRQPRPGLFSGIDWGSDRVLSQTRSRACELGLDCRLLATRRDLDTPADLQAFQDRVAVMHRGHQLVELD